MASKQKKVTGYRLFQHLHIISGLFASVYLLIVGITTLNFQHHFLPEIPTDTIKYTTHIEYDSSLTTDSLARYITSSLGIEGHTPRWEFRQDSSGQFSFKIFRPAQSYNINITHGNTAIEVTEIHYSIGKILAALHKGSIGELNDIFLITWSYYAQLAALLTLATIISSIYFWGKKSIKTRKQWLITIVIGIFSIIYILLIWLIG